jgi:protein-tyrosine-phosphatase
MAAGFLRQRGGPAIAVRSAGTLPADQINPVAVDAMAELGIDISSTAPALLTPETIEVSDFVITMGCGDACPYFPGRTYLDWPLDDPAGKSLDDVRSIRDTISALVDDLIKRINDVKPH